MTEYTPSETVNLSIFIGFGRDIDNEPQSQKVHGVLNLCCSVLQCVAVCCSVLQCVAVRCSALQCVVVCCMLQCVACCSVLQSVAVCCSVLQCVAVCCSVLQCAAVCCSMLQWFGASLHHNLQTQTALNYEEHLNINNSWKVTAVVISMLKALAY